MGSQACQDSEKVADTADKATPLANRRTSWAGSSHRPKHMRWRDKVAYVEKQASFKTKKTATSEGPQGRMSEDSCESTEDTLTVEPAGGSCTSSSKKLSSRPHRYSDAFTHHPHHITFQEKMKFLQGHHRNTDSNQHAEQVVH